MIIGITGKTPADLIIALRLSTLTAFVFGVGLALFKVQLLVGGLPLALVVLVLGTLTLGACGLALMVLLSLLPIGVAQAWASIERGLWFARSADFLQLPWLETLRWLRIIGDTVFMIGTGALAYFMIGLWTGWSYEPEGATVAEGLSGPVPSLGD